MGALAAKIAEGGKSETKTQTTIPDPKRLNKTLKQVM